MREPILTIYNQHTAECGAPPTLRKESHDPYLGYFENRYGEQWIFTFDRKTRAGTLRGGDTGWETVYEVREGKVEGLIFAEGEIEWLQACWKVATA